MTDTMINASKLLSIWDELCEEIDDQEREQSTIWRLLRCQYRMLQVKKCITCEQIDKFKNSVARFRHFTEDSVLL